MTFTQFATVFLLNQHYRMCNRLLARNQSINYQNRTEHQLYYISGHVTCEEKTKSNYLWGKTYTEQKKKLYTYLFSHISANTYPRNIIFTPN